VPAIGPDGNYPVPVVGTCPALFDHLPTHVGLGAAPNQPRIDRGRAIFVFNATPKDRKPFCGHRPGAEECEQWAPCADQQDRIWGQGPMWWFAQYPGTTCAEGSWTVDECQVEHPSRECDAREKADDAARGLDPSVCRRPDAFQGGEVVAPTGANGGPPGRITICVAPHAQPEKRQCRTWDRFADGRWSLIE